MFLVLAALAQLKLWLQRLAEVYQQTVDGPSKLIAPAITILSGSYAIYKGYMYAESRLHYRLGDYIAREEKRLTDARRQLRLIIERPNVERRFREPIFLEGPLKRAVHELGWGSYFLGPQLGYVRYQLETSITRLQHQVKLAETNHGHMVRQLTTAHVLRGAMDVADAATAPCSGNGRQIVNQQRLASFSIRFGTSTRKTAKLSNTPLICTLSLRQDIEAEARYSIVFST